MTRRSATATALSITSPAQLTGLFLWLRSDLGVTLNVSAVSAWADQSGNSNNVSQGTGANQPAFVSSGGGGNKAFIQYTGQGSQSLDNGSVTLAQPFEEFIAYHQNAALGAAGATYLFDIGSGGSQGATIQVSQSTTVEFASGDSQFTTTAGDHIIDAQLNGSSSSIAVDGGTPVGSTHAQTMSQVHVGQAGGLTTFGANGNFYEIAVYSRILSFAERRAVIRYMGNRYAVAVP